MPPGRSAGPGPIGPLERLLASRREQFVRDHWGRTPLLVTASERDAHPKETAELFSPAAVDDLLTRRGLRTPFLRMAQAGHPLPERDYTIGGGVGAGIGDQVDEDAVRRRFDDGATIVLQGLHRTWPPVVDLAQSLAAELGHPVQVNAYVTPPGHQGFAAHYDIHDVFVVQVHGAKRWRVHRPVWPHPLRDQPWEQRRTAVAEAATGDPDLAVELRRGDVLYLPRGYLHSATASDQISIHLTIGIHTWTRMHLADALLQQVRRTLAEDVRLRESLPVGIDVGIDPGLDPGLHMAAEPSCQPAEAEAEAEAAVSMVRQALRRAVDELPAATIAAALGATARAAQRPEPRPVLEQLAAADALTATDALRLRGHLMATLESSGPDSSAALVVRSRAGRTPVPAAAQGAVARLLAGEPVRVAELVPGEEAASGRLARRLLVDGIAVVD